MNAVVSRIGMTGRVAMGCYPSGGARRAQDLVEIDGRIQSLAFTGGQAVTRRQILVTLDPAEYEADVAQKEATVGLWQLKFSRARDLMGRKVMSKQDYDEAEASLKVASRFGARP